MTLPVSEHDQPHMKAWRFSRRRRSRRGHDHTSFRRLSDLVKTYTAQAYVTRLDQRKPVALRISAIFNAPDKAEAERLLRQAIETWKTEAPKLAQWAEENMPDGFTVFDCHTASDHDSALRTAWNA
jgi:hypothetical protein